MWKWFYPLLGTSDVTSKPKLLVSEFKPCFRYAEREQGFVPLLSISSIQFVCIHTTQGWLSLYQSQQLLYYLPLNFRSDCCLFTCHNTWHLWLVQIIKVNCSGFELLSAGSCWRGKLALYLAFVQWIWEIKPGELQWEFSPPLPRDVCTSLPNCLLKWGSSFLSQTSFSTSAVSLNKQNPNHKDCFKWQVCNKLGKWMKAESFQSLMR